MQNYHADFGSLPPAYVADENGKPMHSWRVLLLPYLELKEVYEQYSFDEPWNGPNNSNLAEKGAGVYECPSRYEYPTRFTTGYLAVLGDQTPWSGSGTTNRQEIADGRDRILIVESSVSVHWMEPRDLEFDQMSFSINDRGSRGIGSNHFTPAVFPKSNLGAHVLLIDGSVRFLGNRFDSETIRSMLTTKSPEVVHLDR